MTERRSSVAVAKIKQLDRPMSILISKSDDKKISDDKKNQ